MNNAVLCSGKVNSCTSIDCWFLQAFTADLIKIVNGLEESEYFQHFKN